MTTDAIIVQIQQVPGPSLPLCNADPKLIASRLHARAARNEKGRSVPFLSFFSKERRLVFSKAPPPLSLGGHRITMTDDGSVCQAADAGGVSKSSQPQDSKTGVI